MVDDKHICSIAELNRVHLREMKLSESELTLLSEVGLAVTQLLELEEILDLALRTFAELLGMDSVMIYLQEPLSGRYELRASRGIDPDQKREIESRRLAGQDITQQVIASGDVFFVKDMSADQRFAGVWNPLAYRSYVKFPLMSRGGVSGVLGLVTPAGQILDPREVEFLKVVGRVIGIGLENAALLDEAKQNERRAKSLYQLGMKISSSLSLANVLETVADSIRHLMEADISAVALVEGDKSTLVMEPILGRRTSCLPGFSEVSPDQFPWKELLAGQSIQIHTHEREHSPLYEDKFTQREGVQSLLAVPLIRAGSFLGLAVLMYRSPRSFARQDIQMMERLTHQVVLSIENAQLYHQLHHLAVLEERDRLARELHDNLSQTLGYLKVKTCMTEDLLTAGEVEKARESLQQLKKVSDLLYTDVRESIFNLRADFRSQQGFFATLQEYLAKYRTHYGLHVDLVIENECCLDIPEQVSCQLLRIIQEALSNVRKHAQARKVLLICSRVEDQMLVEIEDDGRGFPLESMEGKNRDSYGLQIMRERAESIGGRLAIDSRVGKGTRVEVYCPLAELPGEGRS
ncbi:MAG: GAF domain-containing sensor histidine kinase [Anaerolineales bacterium]|nr:GAF domain-containing sensor histidine kinase [Anaerolineales bacterium]